MGMCKHVKKLASRDEQPERKCSKLYLTSDHDTHPIQLNTMATVGHARDQQDTVETVPGLVAASTQAVDVERGEHDKNKDKDEDSLEAKERDQHGSIDYEKMQHQAIGVTRIETLWRHFGTNRPVLTALGLSIFCKTRSSSSQDCMHMES